MVVVKQPRQRHRAGQEGVILMNSRMRAGLTTIVAVAGTATFTVLGTAGAASATPMARAEPLSGHHGSCIIRVHEETSGAFRNNKDVLHGRIVPGSVSVVANQGTGGDNPPVTSFGPGSGYTVSRDWHRVTLQRPYAGSNDRFVTHYAVFKHTRHAPCRVQLRTKTSGAFSNNQDVLRARHIVRGSVYVVANQGQTPGQDNPSVNGFARNNGYNVAYTPRGAVVTLQPPYAGSNDGFTTYYTALRQIRRH